MNVVNDNDADALEIEIDRAIETALTMQAALLEALGLSDAEVATELSKTVPDYARWRAEVRADFPGWLRQHGAAIH